MSEFVAACVDAGVGDLVSTATLERAMYSSDASLYRVPPLAVARPRNERDVVTLMEIASRMGVAVTPRGAGTSCAGNAVGPGLVLDMRRLCECTIDPEARLAHVQPGVVLADLNRMAAVHGLRYGPDPSTASRCTIAGMVGNNACGPRAMYYGRTSDTVREVRYVAADGRIETAGQGERWEHLRDLVAASLGPIRTQCGRFPRQISGYSLEHLLPERWNPAAFWAGTEGTLGVTTSLTVALSPSPAATCLVALGYPSMADAADAVPALLRFSPIACEGLDDAILDVLRRRGRTLPPLPTGTGFLLLEVGADTVESARDLAEELVATGLHEGAVDGFATTDTALWRIRADAAGLAAVGLENPAHAGWEDAAVPPERLGAYLREFQALVAAHGLHTLPYGHFGSGCVHARIDFPLTAPDGAQRYRAFITEAADLVARHGGSMSGEHGDGRARSELLPRMYSPEILTLFGAVKDVFDPANLLNPGVLVDPAPLEASIRVHDAAATPFARAHADFAAHVHRCTGVGACTSHQPGASMCPSHRATGDEKDSTRGRARTLQEMIDGRLVTGGWDSPEVAEALESCLACKACLRECPTSVDMASLKSQVLEGRFRRRIRPLTHYALGWLPRWLRLARRVPRLANLAIPLLAPLAGIDRKRQFPKVRPLPEPPTFPEPAEGPFPEPAEGSLPEPAEGSLPEPVEGPVEGSTNGTIPELVERSLPEPVEGASTSSATVDPRACRGATIPELVEGSTHQTIPELVEGPAEGSGELQPVAVWVDSFSQSFSPTAVAAITEVLISAGFAPQLVTDACCGLTWITTGQRDGARRRLRSAMDVLAPIAERMPIVGMEPSCTAVWRSDAAELLPDDPRVATVAGQMHTLAEFLTQAAWTPPSLAGHRIVAQPHCHHRAVMGWEADEALLRAAGADVVEVHGCCGMAGNFGMEASHRELSLQVAELELLPAIRVAGEDAILLADGFSCRTQIVDLTGREGRTLAEVLASHLPR